MTSVAEIRALLARLEGEPADGIESETLECKAWNPSQRDSFVRELRETVVCLANARGGIIILGVADRKRTRREAIHGVGNLDANDLRRKIYDGTEPRILVEIEDLVEPEGRLLLVRVPRGMPPHTTSEGVGKIRVGKECKPLTGSDLSRLLFAGGERDLTAQVLPGSRLEDLDPEQIHLLERTIRSEAGNRDLALLPPAELLHNLELMKETELSLAAVILLGRPEALARWVPQHEVIFLKFRKQTQYDVRHDLKGPLLAVLDALQRTLEANLRIATVDMAGFGELTVPDLSWWSAREAVLNAVVHRDYFLRQSVQIELHRDRLEVSSPGGFVGGVTPENILRHPPVRRNPLLANVLQTVGLVNRAGLGVDRIYHELLRLGKGMPRFEADEANVRLTLPTTTHREFVRFISDEIRAGRSWDLDDLILLRAVVERGSLDRWSGAQRLQLQEAEAATLLASLRARGYLVPRGRGPGTVYRLALRLSDALRSPGENDREMPLDDEALALRVQTALAERGKLTNTEVRRISGYSRPEVLRLMHTLHDRGLVQLRGRGRGSHYLPGPELASRKKPPATRRKAPGRRRSNSGTD